MGDYDRRRFRQIIVPADVYRELRRLRGPGESFGDAIRRLLGGSTKRGRSMDELLALARVARRERDRKVAAGQVKFLGRSP